MNPLQPGNVDPKLAVFEIMLPRSQIAPVWKSDQNTPVVQDLQRTLNNIHDGKFEELDKKINDYALENHFVTLTNGEFYEVEPGGYKRTTPKIQVKEGTITWYFTGVGNNETTQEFRDLIFRTAALGHFLVDGACSKYYRGTNALHIKRMHTDEQESTTNHNHYRVHDNHLTGHQFAQHLHGFIKAQEAYGIPNKFLNEEEAEELIKEYQKFDQSLDQIVPDGDGVTTLRDIYHQAEVEKWSREDMEELDENRDIENPCETKEIIIPLNAKKIEIAGEKIYPKNWVTHNFDRTILDIISKAGSEGQKSFKAHTRQMPDSAFPVLPNAYNRLGELFDKQINRNYPALPPENLL